MADGSATKKTGIFEPLLPPLHPVSSTNRGAYVLLTAVLMIAITGLTVAVKLQMTLSTFRKLRKDDVALIFALLFALGYTIAICHAVNHGLGRAASELTSTQVQLLSQDYYVANILLWLSMASSKCAVALLIIAIEPPKRWIVVALYSMLGIAVAWGVTASLVVGFQCSPNHSALGPTSTDSCIDQFGAQIGIRLIDIASDVVLSVLPAFMMASVHTSFQRRASVSLMFGLRVTTPVFAAIALSSLAAFYNTPARNRPFAAVNSSIWTCVALNVSLLTACLPSIKRVLASWASGFSNAGIMMAFEMQESANRSKSGQLSGTPRALSGAALPRSRIRSKAERETDGEEALTNYDREGRDADSARSEEDAESRRGLTDGITQTIDYVVTSARNSSS